MALSCTDYCTWGVLGTSRWCAPRWKKMSLGYWPFCVECAWSGFLPPPTCAHLVQSPPWPQTHWDPEVDADLLSVVGMLFCNSLLVVCSFVVLFILDEHNEFLLREQTLNQRNNTVKVLTSHLNCWCYLKYVSYFLFSIGVCSAFNVTLKAMLSLPSITLFC